MMASSYMRLEKGIEVVEGKISGSGHQFDPALSVISH